MRQGCVHLKIKANTKRGQNPRRATVVSLLQGASRLPCNKPINPVGEICEVFGAEATETSRGGQALSLEAL